MMLAFMSDNRMARPIYCFSNHMNVDFASVCIGIQSTICAIRMYVSFVEDVHDLEILSGYG